MASDLAASAPKDPTQMLAELERRLRATPRAARPLEHAALQYMVGLAHAELPSGDRAQNFATAITHYQRAAQLFSPYRMPAEHARVQTAYGAALRELGRPAEAVTACERAVELLVHGHSPAELGAALNNLGLARSDVGNHDGAIEALGQAVQVFNAADESRQLVMARYNLGQAHDAAGNHAQAVEVYQQALEEIDLETLPYQWGLLEHAQGVALTSIGGSAEAAVKAFKASMRVFSRQRYPFQFALAKNNYGLACAQLGGKAYLRRAIAAFEDALQVFDVRVHRDQWQQTFKNMDMAEQALAELGIKEDRAHNFAALIASIDDEDDRMGTLRERLMVLMQLPENRRAEQLAELDLAMLSLDDEGAHRTTSTWLNVLMELPNDLLLAGVQARLAAHEHIEDDDARVHANEILDYTVQNELLAPQRIRMRDTLGMFGWERP